jgi:hypothetical protein
MQIDLMCSAQMTSEKGSLIPQRCSDRLTNRFSMAGDPRRLESKPHTIRTCGCYLSDGRRTTEP